MAEYDGPPYSHIRLHMVSFSPVMTEYVGPPYSHTRLHTVSFSPVMTMMAHHTRTLDYIRSVSHQWWLWWPTILTHSTTYGQFLTSDDYDGPPYSHTRLHTVSFSPVMTMMVHHTHTLDYIRSVSHQWWLWWPTILTHSTTYGQFLTSDDYDGPPYSHTRLHTVSFSLSMMAHHTHTLDYIRSVSHQWWLWWPTILAHSTTYGQFLTSDDYDGPPYSHTRLHTVSFSPVMTMMVHHTHTLDYIRSVSHQWWLWWPTILTHSTTYGQFLTSDDWVWWPTILTHSTTYGQFLTSDDWVWWPTILTHSTTYGQFLTSDDYDGPPYSHTRLHTVSFSLSMMAHHTHTLDYIRSVSHQWWLWWPTILAHSTTYGQFLTSDDWVWWPTILTHSTTYGQFLTSDDYDGPPYSHTRLHTVSFSPVMTEYDGQPYSHTRLHTVSFSLSMMAHHTRTLDYIRSVSHQWWLSMMAHHTHTLDYIRSVSHQWWLWWPTILAHSTTYGQFLTSDDWVWWPTILAHSTTYGQFLTEYDGPPYSHTRLHTVSFSLSMMAHILAHSTTFGQFLTSDDYDDPPYSHTRLHTVNFSLSMMTHHTRTLDYIRSVSHQWWLWWSTILAHSTTYGQFLTSDDYDDPPYSHTRLHTVSFSPVMTMMTHHTHTLDYIRSVSLWVWWPTILTHSTTYGQFLSEYDDPPYSHTRLHTVSFSLSMMTHHTHTLDYIRSVSHQWWLWWPTILAHSTTYGQFLTSDDYDGPPYSHTRLHTVSFSLSMMTHHTHTLDYIRSVSLWVWWPTILTHSTTYGQFLTSDDYDGPPYSHTRLHTVSFSLSMMTHHTHTLDYIRSVSLWVWWPTILTHSTTYGQFLSEYDDPPYSHTRLHMVSFPLSMMTHHTHTLDYIRSVSHWVWWPTILTHSTTYGQFLTSDDYDGPPYSHTRLHTVSFSPVMTMMAHHTHTLDYIWSVSHQWWLWWPTILTHSTTYGQFLTSDDYDGPPYSHTRLHTVSFSLSMMTHHTHTLDYIRSVSHQWWLSMMVHHTHTLDYIRSVSHQWWLCWPTILAHSTTYGQFLTEYDGPHTRTLDYIWSVSHQWWLWWSTILAHSTTYGQFLSEYDGPPYSHTRLHTVSFSLSMMAHILAHSTTYGQFLTEYVGPPYSHTRLHTVSFSPVMTMMAHHTHTLDYIRSVSHQWWLWWPTILAHSTTYGQFLTSDDYDDPPYSHTPLHTVSFSPVMTEYDGPPYSHTPLHTVSFSPVMTMMAHILAHSTTYGQFLTSDDYDGPPYSHTRLHTVNFSPVMTMMVHHTHTLDYTRSISLWVWWPTILTHSTTYGQFLTSDGYDGPPYSHTRLHLVSFSPVMAMMVHHTHTLDYIRSVSLWLWWPTILTHSTTFGQFLTSDDYDGPPYSHTRLHTVSFSLSMMAHHTHTLDYIRSVSHQWWLSMMVHHTHTLHYIRSVSHQWWLWWPTILAHSTTYGQFLTSDDYDGPPYSHTRLHTVSFSPVMTEYDGPPYSHTRLHTVSFSPVMTMMTHHTHTLHYIRSVSHQWWLWWSTILTHSTTYGQFLTEYDGPPYSHTRLHTVSFSPVMTMMAHHTHTLDYIRSVSHQWWVWWPTILTHSTTYGQFLTSDDYDGPPYSHTRLHTVSFSPVMSMMAHHTRTLDYIRSVSHQWWLWWPTILTHSTTYGQFLTSDDYDGPPYSHTRLHTVSFSLSMMTHHTHTLDYIRSVSHQWWLWWPTILTHSTTYGQFLTSDDYDGPPYSHTRLHTVSFSPVMTEYDGPPYSHTRLHTVSFSPVMTVMAHHTRTLDYIRSVSHWVWWPTILTHSTTYGQFLTSDDYDGPPYSHTRLHTVSFSLTMMAHHTHTLDYIRSVSHQWWLTMMTHHTRTLDYIRSVSHQWWLSMMVHHTHTLHYIWSVSHQWWLWWPTILAHSTTYGQFLTSDDYDGPPHSHTRLHTVSFSPVMTMMAHHTHTLDYIRSVSHQWWLSMMTHHTHTLDYIRSVSHQWWLTMMTHHTRTLDYIRSVSHQWWLTMMTHHTHTLDYIRSVSHQWWLWWPTILTHSTTYGQFLSEYDDPPYSHTRLHTVSFSPVMTMMAHHTHTLDYIWSVSHQWWLWWPTILTHSTTYGQFLTSDDWVWWPTILTHSTTYGQFLTEYDGPPYSHTRLHMVSFSPVMTMMAHHTHTLDYIRSVSHQWWLWWPTILAHSTTYGQFLTSDDYDGPPYSHTRLHTVSFSPVMTVMAHHTHTLDYIWSVSHQWWLSMMVHHTHTLDYIRSVSHQWWLWWPTILTHSTTYGQFLTSDDYDGPPYSHTRLHMVSFSPVMTDYDGPPYSHTRLHTVSFSLTMMAHHTHTLDYIRSVSHQWWLWWSTTLAHSTTYGQFLTSDDWVWWPTILAHSTTYGQFLTSDDWVWWPTILTHSTTYGQFLTSDDWLWWPTILAHSTTYGQFLTSDDYDGQPYSHTRLHTVSFSPVTTMMANHTRTLDYIRSVSHQWRLWWPTILAHSTIYGQFLTSDDYDGPPYLHTRLHTVSFSPVMTMMANHTRTLDYIRSVSHQWWLWWPTILTHSTTYGQFLTSDDYDGPPYSHTRLHTVSFSPVMTMMTHHTRTLDYIRSVSHQWWLWWPTILTHSTTYGQFLTSDDYDGPPYSHTRLHTVSFSPVMTMMAHHTHTLDYIRSVSHQWWLSMMAHHTHTLDYIWSVSHQWWLSMMAHHTRTHDYIRSVSHQWWLWWSTILTHSTTYGQFLTSDDYDGPPYSHTRLHTVSFSPVMTMMAHHTHTLDYIRSVSHQWWLSMMAHHTHTLDYIWSVSHQWWLSMMAHHTHTLDYIRSVSHWVWWPTILAHSTTYGQFLTSDDWLWWPTILTHSTTYGQFLTSDDWVWWPTILAHTTTYGQFLTEYDGPPYSHTRLHMVSFSLSMMAHHTHTLDYIWSVSHWVWWPTILAHTTTYGQFLTEYDGPPYSHTRLHTVSFSLSMMAHHTHTLDYIWSVSHQWWLSMMAHHTRTLDYIRSVSHQWWLWWPTILAHSTTYGQFLTSDDWVWWPTILAHTTTYGQFLTSDDYDGPPYSHTRLHTVSFSPVMTEYDGPPYSHTRLHTVSFSPVMTEYDGPPYSHTRLHMVSFSPVMTMMAHHTHTLDYIRSVSHQWWLWWSTTLAHSTTYGQFLTSDDWLWWPTILTHSTTYGQFLSSDDYDGPPYSHTRLHTVSFSPVMTMMAHHTHTLDYTRSISLWVWWPTILAHSTTYGQFLTSDDYDGPPYSHTRLHTVSFSPVTTMMAHHTHTLDYIRSVSHQWWLWWPTIFTHSTTYGQFLTSDDYDGPPYSHTRLHTVSFSPVMTMMTHHTHTLDYIRSVSHQWWLTMMAHHTHTLDYIRSVSHQWWLWWPTILTHSTTYGQFLTSDDWVWWPTILTHSTTYGQFLTSDDWVWWPTILAHSTTYGQFLTSDDWVWWPTILTHSTTYGQFLTSDDWVWWPTILTHSTTYGQFLTSDDYDGPPYSHTRLHTVSFSPVMTMMAHHTHTLDYIRSVSHQWWLWWPTILAHSTTYGQFLTSDDWVWWPTILAHSTTYGQFLTSDDYDGPPYSHTRLHTVSFSPVTTMMAHHTHTLDYIRSVSHQWWLWWPTILAHSTTYGQFLTSDDYDDPPYSHTRLHTVSFSPVMTEYDGPPYSHTRLHTVSFSPVMTVMANHTRTLDYIRSVSHWVWWPTILTHSTTYGQFLTEYDDPPYSHTRLHMVSFSLWWPTILTHSTTYGQFLTEYDDPPYSHTRLHTVSFSLSMMAHHTHTLDYIWSVSHQWWLWWPTILTHSTTYGQFLTEYDDPPYSHTRLHTVSFSLSMMTHHTHTLDYIRSVSHWVWWPTILTHSTTYGQFLTEYDDPPYSHTRLHMVSFSLSMMAHHTHTLDYIRSVSHQWWLSMMAHHTHTLDYIRSVSHQWWLWWPTILAHSTTYGQFLTSDDYDGPPYSHTRLHTVSFSPVMTMMAHHTHTLDYIRSVSHWVWWPTILTHSTTYGQFLTEYDGPPYSHTRLHTVSFSPVMTEYDGPPYSHTRLHTVSFSPVMTEYDGPPYSHTRLHTVSFSPVMTMMAHHTRTLDYIRSVSHQWWLWWSTILTHSTTYGQFLTSDDYDGPPYSHTRLHTVSFSPVMTMMAHHTHTLDYIRSVSHQWWLWWPTILTHSTTYGQFLTEYDDPPYSHTRLHMVSFSLSMMAHHTHTLDYIRSVSHQWWLSMMAHHTHTLDYIRSVSHQWWLWWPTILAHSTTYGQFLTSDDCDGPPYSHTRLHTVSFSPVMTVLAHHTHTLDYIRSVSHQWWLWWPTILTHSTTYGQFLTSDDYDGPPYSHTWLHTVSFSPVMTEVAWTWHHELYVFH